MAFCGQCGLLLNTNITKCPRCGAATDFDAATPETPEDDNSATIIAHTNNAQPGSVPYTPPPQSFPSDTKKATYYIAPGGNTYPQNSSHPTPAGLSQSSSNFMTPNSLPQGYNQVPEMYPPGIFPPTNPSYPFQTPPPPPPSKTSKWPFVLIIVLIVALVAVTGMFFVLGSNSFTGLFGAKNTPTTQLTPTTPPAATTQQNTPATTQSTPITATPSTLPAQAAIQQYYADINNHDYQDAYNLWVSNPDNYNHYKQGFVHTHHDDITFGDAIPQVDGTVQVNITLQATEDASGGGTTVSIYHGYYIVGQQTDGRWKIIAGQLA